MNATTLDNTFIIKSLEDLAQLSKKLSNILKIGDIVYLEGNLGAGKTTMVQNIMRNLGVTGSIKSPTFTLVETYEIHNMVLQHFDLYRLADPEELEWIGIRDYFDQKHITFIEWPKKGFSCIPDPTWTISIKYCAKSNQRAISMCKHQDKVI